MATIRGTNNGDAINGTGDGDTIRGLGGDDSILGLGGDDILFGGAGNDYLSGGAGNDVIYGEAGTDTLNGGGGADRFVFTDTVGDDDPSGLTFAATIQDFSRRQGDKIDLSAVFGSDLPWLGYRSDGGTGPSGGPDDVGVSWRNVTVNGMPQTVIDIRTVDGATGDGYMQIILDGGLSMVPSDFLL